MDGIDIKSNIPSDTYDVIKKSGLLEKVYLDIGKKGNKLSPIKKTLYKQLMEGKINPNITFEDFNKIE